MTRYRRVETGTFFDRNVRALSKPPPNGRDLWLYLICGPRTTIFPGLVVATEAVIADDLGWPVSADLFAPPGDGPRSFRDAWTEIESKGMARADWTAGIVLLPKALIDRSGRARESARPTSPNAFKGWAKSWAEVPDCETKDWYLTELGRFADALDDEQQPARGTRSQRVSNASRTRSQPEIEIEMPYRDAYMDAFATRLERVSNASRTRLEPTRVPVPVSGTGSGRGPDLSVIGLSTAPDPDRGLPGDRQQVMSVDVGVAGRVPSTLAAGDPRAAEKKRLLREMAALHVEIFNRVRGELGAKVPAMAVVGDPAELALLALLNAQVSLVGFEEAARHVLEVREDEARTKRTVKFLGQSVWDPDGFGIAKSMQVGEDRSSSPRAQCGEHPQLAAQRAKIARLEAEEAAKKGTAT